MPKLFIFLAVILTSLGFYSFAEASTQDLQGYIYSETVGWISLNCSNTNSCDTINYKVSKDSKGNLSGYGYSQDNQWIDFNPIYGGVSVGAENSPSGWAYSDSGDWLYISGTKIFSENDLKNDVATTESIVNSDASADLSGANTISLLNNLCNQFFSASECSAIN